ncbi:MAG: putative bifunctional diguanylate cyclase/phosphodiesterase [Thermomicrobiales bacterium]
MVTRADPDRQLDGRPPAAGDRARPRAVDAIPAITYTRSGDAAARIVSIGPEAKAVLGWDPDDLLLQADGWLPRVHPFDRERVRAAIGESAAALVPFHAEYRVLARDGRVVWLRDLAVPIEDPASSAHLWRGVLFDISTDKAAESQLHRLAFYDPLTDLPNRRLCIDRLQAILGRSEQKTVALLFLDLDRFKVINDGIGHAAGDELLVAVAQRLAPHVAAHGFLCRFGGDEFVAILEAVEGLPGVEAVARTLLSALRQPFVANGYELIVEGTIGVALSSAALATPKDLLRAADVALYRAKALGGDAFAVFDPPLDQESLERLDQEAELRRALERGEFHIAYQPVVDITTRRILAVEALLRWHHPQRGILPPSAFLPLAEETGLIVPLGRWVIEEACRQIRHWQERFPSARSLQVSVNLSLRQFRQAALETDVARALGQSGLAPQSLALELKEGDALANSTAIATTLKELKRLGVKVTIDDFGKGWAALSSLTQFTIDDLKIDGSCIARLGQHQQDAAVVQALVSMAKAIGLDVTAGAVETHEQLAMLQELGCDRAQGHHFAPPLTVAEIEQLLQREGGDVMRLTDAGDGHQR